jgi:hypothetical protein
MENGDNLGFLRKKLDHPRTKNYQFLHLTLWKIEATFFQNEHFLRSVDDSRQKKILGSKMGNIRRNEELSRAIN